MDSTVAPACTAPADWSHAHALGRRAPSRDARSFVEAQLAVHELLPLAEVAGVVAAILARDVALRGTSALVVTLARRDAVIALDVDDTSGSVPAQPTGPTGPTGPSLLDVPAGSGILSLLTEGWGVTWVSGRATGLWARFEVRDAPG